MSEAEAGSANDSLLSAVSNTKPLFG